MTTAGSPSRPGAALDEPSPPSEWVAPQQVSPRRRASWSGIVAAIWPTHRAVLLGCIGTAVLLAALVVWLRYWAVGLIADVTASPVCQGASGLESADCSRALSDARFGRIQRKQSLLQLACLAVTAGAGVLLGVAAFARDFEQRTQVLLLTQGISRTRWWVSKSVLAVLPWSLTTTALGAILAWALSPIWASTAPMDPEQFYLSPLGLFVLGTVSVCLGATVGILMRSTLGAILVAGFLTVAVIVGAEAARPYVVPTDRLISDAAEGYFAAFPPSDSWLRGSGLLNSAGREVSQTADCSDLYQSLSESTTEAEYNRLTGQCLARSGVVATYVDVIFASRFPLLRAIWAGGLLALSALVLAAGFLRVRRRAL